MMENLRFSSNIVKYIASRRAYKNHGGNKKHIKKYSLENFIEQLLW
jgi:hypothetical protein